MEPAQVVEVCKAGGQVLWSNQRKWFQVVFRRRPATRPGHGQVQFHQEEFSTSQGRSLSDSQKKVEVQVKAQVEQVKFQV